MAQAGDVVAAKYRLIHPLGIGGMGTVWRCEHVQLKLQMAIKLLDVRGPTADRAVQRFTREARIAALVRHRNVVSISDFGSDAGAPYLVMELLEGVPLSERLVVAEPLSIGAFLRVIEQTLQGLKAVHEKGVIHRDLKPENIFLVRDDASYIPKLLDFGVSRSIERDKGHTLTREGIVMGTPEYIAPEQARGKMPDVRSDLYSLGVVMYEAIGGVAPFYADNSADVIVAVLNASPVPLDSLRPDVPARLCALVGKAMAKSPDDRFQNAEEMRTAVVDLLRDCPELERLYLPKRFLTHAPNEPAGLFSEPPGEGIDPDKPTLAHPSTRLTRRRRWKVVGLSSVVALAAVIALLTYDRPREAALASARATQNEASAAREAPAQVKVEIVGVPTDGRVLVDGAEVSGPLVYLTRGSGEHAIEVRAPGMKPWGIQYDASKDGRFEFVAEPDIVEADAQPTGATPSETKTRSSGSKRRHGKSKATKDALLRTPDF